MDRTVSIVIVTHGRRQLLLRAIQSCLQQDYPKLEIVVLLNPGDPEAEGAIRAQFPQVKIVRTHRNVGFFPGLNLAIANTDGHFVMTMDDDAYYLAPDVLAKMVCAFDAEPELGAVTCNIEGPKEVTISGDDRYVHVFKTGFTMVPRQAFTEWVGYYPDIFFRSAGETFLATALWDSGRPVKCLVNARMFHDLAMQGRSDRDWKFYGMRSQALCVILREPWFIVPVSLASKFFKSFVNFIRWGHTLTWFSVWWSILIHVPDVLRDRKAVTWKTYQLLWRLQNGVVTRPDELPALGFIARTRANPSPYAVPDATSFSESAGKLVASIVIVTRNRQDELRVAIQSAVKQSAPVEVIVLDDGSKDSTAEMVGQEFPGVRLIRHGESRGYIVRRNEAAKLALAPVIFSIDDDAEFSSPHVVEQTLKDFGHSSIGAVAIPFIEPHKQDETRQVAPESGDVWITDTFVGTAHALRRDMFLAVGGYREPLFHQGEEGDLAIRMLDAGFVVRQGRADLIRHWESPKRDLRRMDYYGARNAVLFVWQNVPWPGFLVHSLATTFNVLTHTFQPSRFLLRLRGVVAGALWCLKNRSARKPVTQASYAKFRRLRRNGSLPLSKIES